MNTTEQDLKERDERYRMMSLMMTHNGQVAYQIFTGKPLQHPIEINAMNLPMGGMPLAVGFRNASLIDRPSDNDVDNPDGTAAPVALEAPAPLPPASPPVKKKNHLKAVK